jgi:hypothetical protein
MSGVILIGSGVVYKLVGVPSLNQYYYSNSSLIEKVRLINDRFSSLEEIEDI